MDITNLTHDITNALGPTLPYLLKAGEAVAGETGKKLTGTAWDGMKNVWAKLRPRLEAKPAAWEAAKDVSNAPDDQDALASLRFQLKKLLTEDERFAEEIKTVWEHANVVGVRTTIQGERNITANDISNSVVITGDKNAVPPTADVDSYASKR